MDVCWSCVIVLGIAVYVFTQLLRFVFGDADLTLLWAEKFGSTPESKLRGKVVWITGASSGIGEELAYQFSALGARLVLSARRENELERIDVLINNGGRTQRSLFIDTDVDVYEALMELNYLGTISVTKQVLPHMMRRGSGIIATVSSVVGFVGAPLATGYSASKHAVQGFFKCLRTELTDYPNITISTICPGPVISSIVHNAFTEQLEKPVSTSSDQTHKMSTERCVHLILVGLANHVKEMWIAQQPFLLFCYLWQYVPTLAWYFTNILGKKRVQNFKAGLDADSGYFSKPKNKNT
ncbi:Dehydrogenase/reductase SDR family member 7 [Triplophysa tibetana]|uniref:Dehydrogenase/reductase SDR family member 7 n=1 Tax=Triplophysa tibetana TaxID=1572043 RepID=A0A5A9P8S7_9TELE|nr:Dehydrogenase/reductase SDR family member 7 [Triplophysa tibetana]